MIMSAPQASTKDLMRRELIACAKDPVYFLKNFAKIVHPQRGRIPFETYPFQDDCIRDFMDHRFNIVLKSRQLGLSTVTAGFATWFAMFARDKTVLIIATKLDVAMNFIKKVKTIIENLPPMFQTIVKITADTKKSLTLSNGSSITAIPTSEDAGRSEALSLLIVDEAAIIKDFEEVWTGLYPTISTGGRAILLSTPKGAAGQFYDIWQMAVNKENDFNPIKLLWSVHPEHDEEWLKKETRGFSPRKVAQEFLCVAEGTRIITKEGYTNVENLKIGDEILTHTGKFQKLLEKKSRLVEETEKLISVSTPGNRKNPVFATGNHPVLCYRMFANNQSSFEVLSRSNVEPTWITLEKLLERRKTTNRILGGLFPTLDKDEIKSSDDFIDLSKLYQSIDVTAHTCRYKKQWGETSRFVKLDYDLGKMIGLYLAEGCFGRLDGLDLGFHIDEFDTHRAWVEKFLTNLGCRVLSEKAKKSKACRIWTYNKHAGALMRHFVKGRLAHQKILNWDAVAATNIDFIKGLLEGHYLGDGNHKHTTKFSIFSTSSQLIYQLRTLYSLLKLYPRIGYVNRERKNSKHHDMWYLEFFADGMSYDDLIKIGHHRKNGSRTMLHNNMFVGSHTLIDESHKIENDGGVTVFDISVANDSSFVAESLVMHNCDFNASGETFLQPEDMDWLRTQIKSPIDKWGPEQNIWVWERPILGEKYIISADVSRGNAEDFSTFHVFRDSTNAVVAEYKGKIPPDEFGSIIFDVAVKFNSALVCPESNTFGYSTIRTLKLLGYKNLYYDGKRPGYVPMDEKEMAGFSTQKNTKEKILANLEKAIRNKTLKIYSDRLYLELKTFVWVGQRARAQEGNHDDLVMSLAIGSWLLDPNAGGVVSDDYAKAFLNSMCVMSRKADDMIGLGKDVRPLMDPVMMFGAPPRGTPEVQPKGQNLRDHLHKVPSVPDVDTNDFSWLIK